MFTIGTAPQNFVIVNAEMLEHTMRLAGQTPEQAAANAPGFLMGFRIIGCVYVVGNALGLLALTGRKWVFWVALAVNLTQAAGVFAIPPEVFRASVDFYGFAGVLPSIITDGGALLLALLLIAFLIRFRAPWTRRVS
ncbi:hypothetical protein NLX83_13585 [Allokutzneria sp. A3M-2-11 16]|uniref:hypothetical protein n=1 Tax=Allokutzneria sp. A3M-2-11 16 TaxID=2962043 RepID=UPI0020B8DBE4|nr:hypothetical protein [Allokutzneria sp. A3M-2-11 16]MCP3800290.1 hypothetical protein [Allokutzneria sp. A3M-2-11 16]